jgi:serine/threonine protein kinase
MWQPPTLEEMQAMLPQYRFESLLGRGGMGAVYKAVQASLDRPVAIKVLPGDLIDDMDAQFAERFKNEARTMAKMNHPSIVNVYDFGETQTGLLFIVMEFIDGTDVAKMISSQGKLPEDYALSITAHVCDALNYAHRNGVIHRDIKPANILINMEGAVKVADFGLAKQSDTGMSGLTKTNMAMGTPDFVAPEALIPGVPLDGRADLYAVGVMLYQMLTGEIPRGMWTMPGMRLGTDPRFDAIIGKAMQTDREARYQSAAEVRKDLDTILTTPRAALPKQQAAAQTQPSQAPHKPVSHGPRAPQKPEEKQHSAPPPKKVNLGMIIGLGATAVLLIGGYLVMKPATQMKKATVSPAPAASAPVSPQRASEPAPTTQPSAASVLPPLPSRAAKQTLDLLALTDPVLDRVPVPERISKNEWTREGGELVYLPDGKSGKLAAPVVLDCRDYEIEFKAKKHSGNDRIHLDIPLGGTQIIPIILNSPEHKVLTNKHGGSWWGGTDRDVHVSIRVINPPGPADRIRVQQLNVKGNPLADWSGDLDSLARPGEDHPAFPKQPVPSVYVVSDKYAVQTWTLRVFEGEAKVLRETPASVAGRAPPQSAPMASGAVNLLAAVDPKHGTIEGNWSLQNGELHCRAGSYARFAFDHAPPEEYDFRIQFTRTAGTNAISQHVVHAGHDVMWLMGGFGNSTLAFELVGGKPGKDNTTAVKSGIENGRRYESVVKVRRDRIQVELDGKLIVDHKTDGSDLSVNERWRFPDAKKLGVGCQNDAVFHRIELIPVTSKPVEVSPVVAMPSPAGPPATTPASATPAPAAVPTSSDPRLAQLEAGFKARYEADAQKPFLAALAALNQSYVANGIARARAAAQAKGALAEVTTLDAEKTRIQNNEPLPPADLETLPASLKSLRTTYRAAYAKIETERVQKAAPLYDLYLGALDAYIAELTKANKIDDAQKVKTLRDGIAEQKPKTDAGAAPVQTGAATNTGTSRPGGKPAADDGEESAMGRSRWHEAARWVVSVGGFVNVDKNGQQMRVEKESDIPAGRFDIVDVSISGNPKSAGIKDDDFTRFSGLKELRTLRVAGIKVGDAAFAFLPTTPSVTGIVIADAPVTDAVLVHMAPLGNLTSLQIQSAPQFTGAGLEKLASLPVLTSVWFIGSGFSDAGAKALAGAKNLEKVQLSSTRVTDEGIAAFKGLTKLTDINLKDCKNVRGTTLAAWEGMPSLRALYLGSCPISAEVLPVIARFIHLTSLELDYVAALNDETLPALAPLTKLTRFNASSCRISGTGFGAMRGWTELRSLGVGYTATISAEGLATIVATFPMLERLMLGSGAQLQAEDFRPLAGLKALRTLEAPLRTLDDAALAEIAHVTSLETFYAAETAITAKGIAMLNPLKSLTELRLPSCKGIDDSAIPVLKDLKWLKKLDIARTTITDAGAAELKKALPGCNVSR